MNTTETQPPASLGAATGSAIVVCLCGSSRWPELHHRVMMAETLAGNIVIPMGLYGHADYPPGAKAATNDGDESTAVKQMLDRLHYQKIDLADEIIVVSEDGYFGSSTRREIAYAQAQGKRVRYWQNDPSSATGAAGATAARQGGEGGGQEAAGVTAAPVRCSALLGLWCFDGLDVTAACLALLFLALLGVAIADWIADTRANEVSTRGARRIRTARQMPTETPSDTK